MAQIALTNQHRPIFTQIFVTGRQEGQRLYLGAFIYFAECFLTKHPGMGSGYCVLQTSEDLNDLTRETHRDSLSFPVSFSTAFCVKCTFLAQCHVRFSVPVSLCKPHTPLSLSFCVYIHTRTRGTVPGDKSLSYLRSKINICRRLMVCT